jgi:hypothetical protein
VRVPLICAILFCATRLPAASLPPPILKRLNARVPMRDGVTLSANVFRPDVKSRVPTILIRTPYGKGSDLPLGYQPFIDRGYAVVLQDVSRVSHHPRKQCGKQLSCGLRNRSGRQYDPTKHLRRYRFRSFPFHRGWP